MQKIPASTIGSIVKLIAPNDKNGNPNRAFLIHDKFGVPLFMVYEGYRGNNAYRELIELDQYLPTIIPVNVSAREIKTWKKDLEASAIPVIEN